MVARNEVHRLVDALTEDDLQVVARMLRGLTPNTPEAPDAEAVAWLEGDLVEELPPYDWGEMDPLTAGEPVRCEPGVGCVAGDNP